MSDNNKNNINLKVSAESRLPKLQNAYDDERHAYRPEYANPNSWQLNLSADLPPDSRKCEWQVTQEDGSFDNIYQQDELAIDFGRLSVLVPAQGNYHISLTVTDHDGRTQTQQQNYFFRDYLIVAFGDSYYCGEGNPDKVGKPGDGTGPFACNLATFTKFLIEKVDTEIPMEREPVWQEKKVHRSYKSGVSLAAQDLEAPEQGRLITYLNFARSGASIEKGLCGPRDEDDWTELGQVEEAQKTIGDRPIDALLISTGGNDIQFSDRLLDLLRDDLPIVGDGGLLGDDDLNRQKEVNEALRLLDELPAKIDKLAEAVAELKPRKVFLTQYPVGQFDAYDKEGKGITKSGCGIFDGPDMNIDGKDAQAIKESGQKLNAVLRQSAGKHGWTFIDGIADGFAGHGRCSDDKYFYSAEESCKNQGDFRGTLHPNEKGNQVYADCITAALQEHFQFD